MRLSELDLFSISKTSKSTCSIVTRHLPCLSLSTKNAANGPQTRLSNHSFSLRQTACLFAIFIIQPSGAISYICLLKGTISVFLGSQCIKRLRSHSTSIDAEFWLKETSQTSSDLALGDIWGKQWSASELISQRRKDWLGQRGSYGVTFIRRSFTFFFICSLP